MSIKNDIIAILEANRGKVISGGSLAKEFDVSRQYIWKTINSLKSTYDITATTNNGYILADTTDVISKEGIDLYLKSIYKNLDIIVADTLASTNTKAKELAFAGAKHGTIVIADTQTAGRGRCSKTFFSPPHCGIYMSIIIRPTLHIADSLLTTIATANAVCQAIEQYGFKPQIKWVNDIFIANKKVCGILTEAVSNCESGMVDFIVIGVGINVKPTTFPPELANVATSLNIDTARNPIIATLINNILDATASLIDKDAIISQYKDYCFVIGKKINYLKNGKPCSGTVLDINNSANLVIETEDGNNDVLSSGEISLGSENFTK